ncbi:MAG: metal-sensing transcriptional repressor [Patescibacteria group bacterium]
MNYLIGHLRANLKMVEEGRYCIDIIRQNQAVISALKKVNELILRNHLDTCLTRAVRGKSEKQRKKVLEEIVEIFKEGEE